jgi:glycosyltransferase involved in cell wall biosynthesis
MLSIITSTYNDPSGLLKTRLSLEALRVATFEWEWIVVDSSPTESAPSLPSWKELVHLTQEPRGIYAAQNCGLSKAKGEFLWFLNGGDTLVSLASIEKVLARLAEAPESDFAVASANLLSGGKLLRTQYPKEGLFGLLGINRVCHQAVIYRRRLFTRLGNYSEDLKLAADYELHLKAYSLGSIATAVPAAIVNYDMGGQSSNWEKACDEFSLVHSRLTSQGILSFPVAHSAALIFERRRIQLFKMLQTTRAGPLLRKALNAARGLRKSPNNYEK